MKTVCGLNVHKDSVFYFILCTNGEKIQHKLGIPIEDSFTLCNLLLPKVVEDCAMDSSNIYLKPICHLLE